MEALETTVDAVFLMESDDVEYASVYDAPEDERVFMDEFRRENGIQF